MTEKTDSASPAAQAPAESVSSSASAPQPQKKPRFALFVATAAGLGYFPKAPGTLGSLAGVTLEHIPFPGAAQALTALLGKQIDLAMVTLAPAVALAPAAPLVPATPSMSTASRRPASWGSTPFWP